MVAKGEVHPNELLDAALERCARVNPAINAISLLMAEVGRTLTDRPADGPLAGAPFLIKDLSQDFAGYPTSSGTRPLRGLPVERNSLLVQRWLDAGLVVFGKTTTPEFGSKGVTETETFGITRNPWHLDHTSGGSSAGPAAVAAGIVPMAGANDGGGSIRIPAACTGLFGLKSGRGLVPCGVDGGDAVHGAAVEGVLSRSVRDSAVMLDIMAGPDPATRYYSETHRYAYGEAVHTTPPRLRIGFTHESPLGTPVHEEAIRALEHTASLLESLGHHVEPGAPNIDDRQLTKDFATVWLAHSACDIAAACQRTGATPADFDFDTRLMAAIGRALPATSLVDACERWNLHTRALSAFHDTYDLLLTPTLTEPPPRAGTQNIPAMTREILGPLLESGVGEAITATDNPYDNILSNLSWAPFTQLANVTGRPAMTVPLHWTAARLPLGSQFVGAPGSEFLLLQLAAQLEAAHPWTHLEPPEPTLQTT
ncbi:amidase [Nocardia sp. NBC_01499]|uniref:amidase n=1 Tax=Nocardia sp. NBC_01499 TaxID=2903597 RepID=UPI00386457CF